MSVTILYYWVFPNVSKWTQGWHILIWVCCYSWKAQPALLNRSKAWSVWDVAWACSKHTHSCRNALHVAPCTYKVNDLFNLPEVNERERENPQYLSTQTLGKLTICEMSLTPNVSLKQSFSDIHADMLHTNSHNCALGDISGCWGAQLVLISWRAGVCRFRRTPPFLCVCYHS